MTAASTIDTSDLFTLKDAKALYVPAYPNMLGALAEGSFALLAALRVDQRQAHTQRGGMSGGAALGQVTREGAGTLCHMRDGALLVRVLCMSVSMSMLAL